MRPVSYFGYGRYSDLITSGDCADTYDVDSNLCLRCAAR